MANITLSVQDDFLKRARAYAQKHNTSLNALVRSLLQKTVNQDLQKNKYSKIQSLSQKIPGNSKGKTWSRNDIYDV